MRGGASELLQFPSYGRYVGLLGIVIVLLITLNTFLTKPNGVAGVLPGKSVPPFAVPLALAHLKGAADIAPRAGKGDKVAACALRGPEILNVCQLYEGAPVVLTLFVNNGSCPRILGEMQRLAPTFPGVRFAAVEMRGSRSALRRLVRSRHLTLPVGFDEEGTLAPLYKVASCPQVNFIYPGGIVQSQALLYRPSQSLLSARVKELISASAARGRQ